MRIRSHSESHIVELDDGSRWQIFRATSTSPWNGSQKPFWCVPIDDEVSSHAQISAGGKVHVIPVNESWPVREVKSILKDG